MEKFKSIYCRAKSIMSKEDDAQALMKEVYALAEESNVSEEKAEAWMIKQTYIRGCGKFRKKKAREAEMIELQEHEYEAQKGIDCDKTKEIICETLAELPDLYQATLFALYFDQYSMKEVASVTGYNTGVIINRLNYIHKYLSKKLENYQEDNKVKVQFSVEMVYEALKQWAAENTLDDEAVVVPEGNSVEAVKEELQAYSVKRGVVKKQLVVGAAIVGGLVLLALIAILIIGNSDKKDEQDDNQTVIENQEDETEPIVSGDTTDVTEDEVSEDTSSDETSGDGTLDNETSNDDVAGEDESETVSDAEYLLPDSASRKLTRADLQGLSKEELRLARNEIFARHGVIFDVPDLDAYFGEKSWYQPTISLDEFKENGNMNEYEYANLSLIVEMEEEVE